MAKKKPKQSGISKALGDMLQAAPVHRVHRARELMDEIVRRQQEALEIIRLMPIQERFVNSQARVRVAFGANRSGKTEGSMIDLAMICMGRHPFRKYPKKYRGRIYIVGRDQTALGEVFWKKLFGVGGFKMIKDEHTKRWRAYHPVDDAHRISSARQSPPLIPDRCVISKSFRLKKANIPKRFVIKNDLGQRWELHFFTAEGKPQRGVDLDAVYLSEEIEDPDWIYEMFPRLMDRHGFMVWDATPQDGAEHFLQLLDDAEAKQADSKGEVRVESFHYRIVENIHIPPEEREFLMASIKTEEERLVRIEGLPNRRGFMLFPEFKIDKHCIPLSALEGEIPSDWVKYAAIDPGYECAGVLFVAIPPPYHPWRRKIVVYDEIYLPQGTGDDLARNMANKTTACSIQTFYIDAHRSLVTETSGKTIGQQLRESFCKHRVRSETTGYGFVPGIGDVEYGCHMFREALRDQDDGRPRILVLRDQCPNFIHEISHLRRKRVKKGSLKVWLDVPAEQQHDHLFDCARYLLNANLSWVPPAKPKRRQPVLEAWRERQQHKRAMKAGTETNSIILGPRVRQYEPSLFKD